MTTLTADIRPFAEQDYEALAEVYNSTRTGHPEGPELLRHFDETRDPKHKHGRLVALSDSRVVAAGEFYQNPGMYHPQKFYLKVAVLPDFHNRGIGARLYDALMAEMRPHDPITVRGVVREDYERARAFVERRGFAEEKRDWESRLDVAVFDPSPYEGMISGLESEGIVIRTLADLQGDPDMPSKYYELWSDARLDVPRPEPATPISYENFREWVFKAPDFRPESHFLALDGERYVGLSQLWIGDDSPDAFTGLTAVRREYRGRKIALALKLRGIAYAKAASIPVIHTDNDSLNAPMLAVNNRLGFVRQPALITYRKNLERGQ